MWRIPTNWLLGLMLAWSLGGEHLAQAASLLSVNVVPDGSIEPPGDRIDVTVLFDPGEEELTLETRAFVRLQGAPEQVVPIDAGVDSYRDREGHVFNRTTVMRDADLREASERVVIPYASLKLPKGRHRVGYEIRALRDGKTEFVHATPMTLMVVSDRTRTLTRQSVDRTVSRMETANVTAYTLKEGRLVAQEIAIGSEVPAQTHEIREVEVEIPGEYARPRPIGTRGTPTNPTPPPATSVRASVGPLEGRAWAPLSEFESKPKRTIYFATNRAVVSPETLTPARFGIETGPALTYGACLVNIPIETHTKGQLETPSYWWQTRDPRKHFLVESLELLARDQLLGRLAPDDVLLFVHGYNTDFESAVLRAGQLVHDLKFPGKGMTFSWPSAGALSGYSDDEENAARSLSALVEVFRGLSGPVEGSGRTRKIHVIAHSMGNRVFLGAVRQYELESPIKPPRKIFGHVALAAPDIDAATFAALLPSVIRQSDTATLYYCQSDRALLASQAFHMNKPVGLGPFFSDGLDTINCDNANTSLLGHDYFASTHPLLIDLKRTILFDEGPDKRFPPLGSRTLYLGYPHWSFLPPR